MIQAAQNMEAEDNLLAQPLEDVAPADIIDEGLFMEEEHEQVNILHVMDN